MTRQENAVLGMLDDAIARIRRVGLDTDTRRDLVTNLVRTLREFDNSDRPGGPDAPASSALAGGW